jgi:hypothetical protein
MTSARLLIPSLLILGSCSSPPKPPTVDESQKRPANAAAAVELQACKGDLQSSRILVAEKSRAAEYSRASLDRLAALQRAPPATEPGASDARSTVYTILSRSPARKSTSRRRRRSSSVEKRSLRHWSC